jgi:dienelactone hydrolase
MPGTFVHGCVGAGILLLAAAAASAQSAPAAPAGSGPYPALMEEAPGLPGFTIHRPHDLAATPALPVVVWGNGSCRNVGNAYPEFHAEIASRGYFVIALGPIVADYVRPRAVRPAPGTPPAQPVTTPPARGPNETQAAQLVAALDWAVAENARAGSPYFGELDVEHVAASGHSCGGLQALWAGAHDARIDTLVIGNSGTFNPPLLEIEVVHADLARLTMPVIYLMGGPTDIAYPQAERDFAAFTSAPVFKANLEVGHGGTYQDANGGEFGRVAVAWLDWQLKSDAAAARIFAGADCALCRDSAWSVERKNLR